MFSWHVMVYSMQVYHIIIIIDKLYSGNSLRRTLLSKREAEQ